MNGNNESLSLNYASYSNSFPRTGLIFVISLSLGNLMGRIMLSCLAWWRHIYVLFHFKSFNWFLERWLTALQHIFNIVMPDTLTCRNKTNYLDKKKKVLFELHWQINCKMPKRKESIFWHDPIKSTTQHIKSYFRILPQESLICLSLLPFLMEPPLLY